MTEVSGHILNDDGVRRANVRYVPDPKIPGAVKAVIDFGTVIPGEDFLQIDFVAGAPGDTADE